MEQPTAAMLQQLPVTVTPPGSALSNRPGGHVKEELVELMMIQNAQMHQVIMNNMTMSALSSFGYAPEPIREPVIFQENDSDPEVYHHYYQPAQYLMYPPHCLQPQATQLYPQDTDRRTAPLPPPPSVRATMAATLPPAAESNSGTEAGAERTV